MITRSVWQELKDFYLHVIEDLKQMLSERPSDEKIKELLKWYEDSVKKIDVYL